MDGFKVCNQNTFCENFPLSLCVQSHRVNKPHHTLPNLIQFKTAICCFVFHDNRFCPCGRPGGRRPRQGQRSNQNITDNNQRPKNHTVSAGSVSLRAFEFSISLLTSIHNFQTLHRAILKNLVFQRSLTLSDSCVNVNRRAGNSFVSKSRWQCKHLPTNQLV